MTSSVVNSRIDPKFANSPYLSRPIGSPTHKASNNNGRRRRRRDDDSVASFKTNTSFRTQRSCRTQKTQQTYSTSQTTSLKNKSVKNIILAPREADKLLRGFRQAHKSDDINAEDDVNDNNDDNSSIDTSFADSIDDKAVYVEISKKKEVVDSIFSGRIFQELTLRNCSTDHDGPIVSLPPVNLIDSRGKSSGDVSSILSDLDESIHPPMDSRTRRKR